MPQSLAQIYLGFFDNGPPGLPAKIRTEMGRALSGGLLQPRWGWNDAPPIPRVRCATLGCERERLWRNCLTGAPSRVVRRNQRLLHKNLSNYRARNLHS